MADKIYDLIIVGSGPGGYVAGIRASQLGLTVGVIEKDNPGGICLNMGCIPSKSLIHQAGLVRSAKELNRMGYILNSSGFQYEYVQKQSRIAAERLSKGVRYLFKKNNVDFIQARAILVNPGTLELSNDTTLTSRKVILASGAGPREIPGFPINGKDILSSNDALLLTELPTSLLILGAGSIGLEFAYIFNAFGVKVYVVEILSHILPHEDQEIADGLKQSLKKQGIKIKTGTRAVSFEKRNNMHTVILENNDGREEAIDVEKILVAAGRVPNTSNLYERELAIEQNKGFINVNVSYETSVPGVYAIGDIVHTPQLAHVASKEGEIAVESIAGVEHIQTINPDCIPRVVYCEPQAAGFGPTQQELEDRNISFEKILFPYKGAGKATAINKTEGFIKLLYTPDTKEIISAFILGHEAGELIHQILLAKTAHILPKDIGRMIHAHPTLSEAVMETMRGVNGWMIHA